MRHRTVLILALIVAASLLGVGTSAASASPTPGAAAELEAELARIVNQERESRGLDRLEVTVQQQRKAREHSGDMAEEQTLRHARDLAGDVFPGDAWTGLGENVVRRRTVEAAHQAFMDSPPHRENLLGDWTHIGVGVAVDGDDLWVTQRFVGVREGHTLPLFTDMPSSGWKRQTVVDAWRTGILAGCGNDRVCADDHLSRAQTATLLARVLEREPDVDAASEFADISSGSVHAGAVGALASDGVTRGCSTDEFCPNEPVSRAATASLISRASGWSLLEQRQFDDVVPEHTHAGTINRLAERGVTDGCSATRYCPSRSVTRVEVARMLARAF